MFFKTRFFLIFTLIFKSSITFSLPSYDDHFGGSNNFWLEKMHQKNLYSTQSSESNKNSNSNTNNKLPKRLEELNSTKKYDFRTYGQNVSNARQKTVARKLGLM